MASARPVDGLAAAPPVLHGQPAAAAHPVDSAAHSAAHSAARSAASGRAWLQGLADAALATRTLQAQRATALLHAGAALLVLGLLLSIYGRGLVLDYRAGWDSTFLTAPQVRAVLGWVLGPAATLTGWGLPDAATLAGLRWAAGGGGDSAARWIHLFALTLAGAVLLPRSLLALAAFWRARRTARHLTLPMVGPYFQALLRDAPARQRPVTVLPYSFNPDARQRAALPATLAGVLGAGAQPQISPCLPMGAEDDLARQLPPVLADTVVALLALSATPERETHGAFVRTLAATLPARCELQVWVDSSGYRQRLGAAPEAGSRLAQRRSAWQHLLAEMALPAPVFVDLAEG